jgi:two-component system, chemotaxis family, sensor kinase CheA
MEEIHTEFIHDAEELLEKLFHDLGLMEAARLHGRGRREVVARIFRYVHTLKGSAASHGVRSVSEIAHEFENVLDGVRLGRVTIDRNSLDAFESAASAMASALGAHARGKNAVESTELIDQLRRIAVDSTREHEAPADVRSALPEEIARALSEYDQQHIREAAQEGARLFAVTAGFEIDTFDQRFRELSRLLEVRGEVVCTVPAPEPAAPTEINFRLLYAVDSVPNDVIERALALGRVEFTELALPQGAEFSSGSLPPQGPGTRSPEVVPSGVVRVGLNQLEDLISDASELFRDAATALGSVLTEKNREVIEVASSHLRQRFVELEERLIKLRLVPLAQMLERAAVRAGRVAARDLGKDVEFEIVGGDLGIDRSLADAIADPLLHLVRNAISHGIESPEERLAAGKRAQGKVRIAAFTEGSHIHISVTDDGRGITPERVGAAAAADGVLGAGSDVTMEECLRLIFRPGFSTAEALSDISGRGIGLDVVDRALSQAGGEVRVITEAGTGTTFEMILPATLALLRCILVRSGEQAYGLESARVTERGTVERQQIRVTKGAEVIDWKGAELPLIRLRALLGQRDAIGQTSSVLIVRTSNHRPAPGKQEDRIALAVDSIEGEHETLVRSLGRHASRWRGVGGATELLDGSVALVLDLEQLIESKGDK